MTARQERFCREYVIDLNGTRAAIAAGYSQIGAGVRASELLKIRKIQKLIDKLQTARASRLELKADRVVEEISRLAFSNMRDYIEVSESGEYQGIDLAKLSRDQAAAIQEIREDTTGGSGDGERKLILRTTLKLSDKAKSLELLGRHLGMFPTRVEVNGQIELRSQAIIDRLNKGRERCRQKKSA